MLFLTAQCQWTFIIYYNLRIAPNVSRIDPGFFKYICERIEISTSQIRVILIR